MKRIAAFVAASALALTFATAVRAEVSDQFEADAFQPTVGGSVTALPGERHHHHPCQGLSSGTAHHSCGSLTGGPSGGLF